MTAVAGLTAPDPMDLTVQGRGWRRELVLSGLAADQRDIDAAEARKLLKITEWADLHRADVVVLDGDTLLPSPLDSHDEPILMSGVPIDEYCLAELSAALRPSHGAARSITEDGLEIRERLPRCWDRVQAGKLPAWKARTIAKQTRSLSDEAADWVDRHLAPFASKLSTTRIKKAVDAAILTFDPDRAAADARAASDGRGVWFDFEHGDDDPVLDESRPDGTMRFEGVASIPDGLAFRDALTTTANELEILGDNSPELVRMSKAIGILADPQYALDLSATADAALAEDPTDDTPPRRRPHRVRTPLGVERPIHIHLHTTTQVARVQASGLPGGPSPIARAAIEQWITDLAPGTRVKVTPVIDLNRHHAVDAYEAPDHLRALVDERDHGCVFPYCTNRGRYDLDHIEPYRDPEDPDDPGPPGQTGNRQLAKLCRFHHRAKTHADWDYRRIASPWDLDPGWPTPWTDPLIDDAGPDRGGPPPTYRWQSPLGHTYLVTATGTFVLD